MLKDTSPQATSEPLPQFVAAGHIAKLYQVTPAAVRFWAKTGRVPCLKFAGTLRFDLAKVRGIIEGATEPRYTE